MATPRPTVTVGFDDSAPARASVHWAAHEAVARQARLRIVTAWDPSPITPWSVGLLAEWRDQARTAAVDAVERARDEVGSALDVEAEAREGRAGDVLVEESGSCDLLVLGSAGHVGLGGLLAGSVSRHCLHHTHSPLAILGPQAHQDGVGRIVLSSSLDPEQETFAWVVERERAAPLPIHVLTTYDSTLGLAELAVTDAQRAIRASVRTDHEHWVGALQEALAAGGVDPAVVTDAVVEGTSLRVLADQTAAGDLIVVPSGCEHAVPIAHGACPILVVPAARRATARAATPDPAHAPAPERAVRRTVPVGQPSVG